MSGTGPDAERFAELLGEDPAGLLADIA